MFDQLLGRSLDWVPGRNGTMSFAEDIGHSSYLGQAVDKSFSKRISSRVIFRSDER